MMNDSLISLTHWYYHILRTNLCYVLDAHYTRRWNQVRRLLLDQLRFGHYLCNSSFMVLQWLLTWSALTCVARVLMRFTVHMFNIHHTYVQYLEVSPIPDNA